MKIKDDKEYCIICKKETPYYRQKHIDCRQFYIYGAGQLCQQCYENIYQNEKEK